MHSTHVDAHRDISNPGDFSQLHSHSFVEILYCLSGSLEYLLGTERCHIHPGDVVIIPPGVSHQPLLTTLPEQDHYERIVIWISNRMISGAGQRWPEEDWSLFDARTEEHPDEGSILRSENLRDPLICESIERIAAESEQENPGWQAVVSGTALTLLVLLTRASSLKVHSFPDSTELIDHIIRYVEGKLSDRITLEETARYFLISESTLSKTFRAHMDTSFYQFVKRRRLIAAKSLLSTDISLSEIPEQVGFGDYTSFYRAFKKEYQLPPGLYREMMRGREAPPAYLPPVP